jgi:pilus assembly protein CpaE
MQAYIVSDHDLTTARLRAVLLCEGLDCPAANILPLDMAGERLPRTQPTLIVLVLSPNPERALAALRQLHLLVSCPVVAVGPTANARLILQALHSGASDFADENDPESELKSALGRILSGGNTQSESAKTIALLAPNGGSGSSTLAVNIATVLAKEHHKALLIDLKLQTGDLAALLDLKPTHTIAELCQNAAHMDRTMLDRSLVRHGSGVQLLAPPRTFADTSLVTPEGVRKVINLGRTLFPYVVLDLDHSFGAEQVQVIRQADLVLLVLRLDFGCLRNAQRTLAHLKDLGIGCGNVRLVVNRYGQPKEIPAAKAEEVLGMKVFHYVPEDATSINRANNNGIPVVVESPSAKVSRSLAQLAHNVNGRVP